MKPASKEEEFEEGELPDEDPLPSESVNKAKPTASVERKAFLGNQDQEDSSGQIIFETVLEKDYNYSPEKKKKKIHKQDAKPKTKEKEKEKVDRSSKEKEKKIQKRKSPTPNISQEESVPPQRDFQQHPPPHLMPSQPFYNPYMYLPPPVNSMMPHMYPPQYPPLPYVHPSQFHYPPMAPPPGAPMSHPHYTMPPPQMYPGYAPKPMMPMKPQPEGLKFQPFKHQQQEYPKHMMHNPQVSQQKYQQIKIEQPSSNPLHAPPIYHNNQNQSNKISQNLQPQPTPLPLPVYQPTTQISRPQTFDRPQAFERPKEKPQIEPIREKKIDVKNEIKKDVKETLRDLPIELQEELLEAIRCILKYSHLSHSLFPSQSGIQSNPSLSCYQNNLAKLQRIMSSSSSDGRASVIEHVLASLQIKQPLLKIKERMLYHKIINEGQHLMGQQLRLQLQGKGA